MENNLRTIGIKRPHCLFDDSIANQNSKEFVLFKAMVSASCKPKKLTRTLFNNNLSPMITRKFADAINFDCMSPIPSEKHPNISPIVSKRPKRISLIREIQSECFCTIKASLLNHSRNCIEKGIPQKHTGLEPETPKGFYCCVDAFECYKQQSNLNLKWSEGIDKVHIIFASKLYLIYILM